jgi:hypothetical protein
MHAHSPRALSSREPELSVYAVLAPHKHKILSYKLFIYIQDVTNNNPTLIPPKNPPQMNFQIQNFFAQLRLTNFFFSHARDYFSAE